MSFRRLLRHTVGPLLALFALCALAAVPWIAARAQTFPPLRPVHPIGPVVQPPSVLPPIWPFSRFARVNAPTYPTTSLVHADSTVRYELRVGGVRTDTAYLLPGDTVPVTVIARAIAGNKLIATGMNHGEGRGPCLTAITRPRPAAKTGAFVIVDHSTSAACTSAFENQSVGIGVYLNGIEYETRLQVVRPAFPLGSPLAVCLSAKPEVLHYVSRDSVVAIAIQMAAGFFVSVAWAEPDSSDVTDSLGQTPTTDSTATTAPVSDTNGAVRSQMLHWPWQSPGARVTLQYHAILCAPGYQARDVTRSKRLHWSTRDPSVARVSSTGTVTWLKPTGFTLLAEYH